MKRACSSLLLGLILGMSGCSSEPPPPDYNSTEALETLIAALDAWKEGKSDSLSTRQTPIRFEDEDCRNGLQLIAYQLASQSTPIQPFDDVTVHLSLRDQQGRNVDKSVVYQVSLKPQSAVLRND